MHRNYSKNLKHKREYKIKRLLNANQIITCNLSSDFSCNIMKYEKYKK